MQLSLIVLCGFVSFSLGRFRQEHHHNLAKRVVEATPYNFENIAADTMKFDTPVETVAGAVNLYAVTKTNTTKACAAKKKKAQAKAALNSLASLPASSPSPAAQYAAKAVTPNSKTADTSSPISKIVLVVAAATTDPSSSTDVIGGVTADIGAVGAAAGALLNGLIGLVSPTCGPSGATKAMPNGAQSFVNCGLSKSNPSSAWTPADIKITQLSYVTLEHALATNDVWKPCTEYIPLFEQFGKEYGIPPIMLASFALQESTCNPNVGGDAIGLMQITSDKCGSLSRTECAAPAYNVKTGAAYFASQLKAYNGNVFAAIGQYNGWQDKTMTINSATAAASSSCCVCQNNLDYIFQMVNGWMIGKTGYTLGSYNNLAVCNQ